MSAKINIMKNKTKDLTLIAIATALTCVLSPLSVPIGVVPIALTNLVLLLNTYVLGYKKALVACLLYIIIGAIGIPVFANFSGGIGILTGPTGGYIIGYIPMVLVAGLLIEKFENKVIHIIAMIIGTALCYTLGTWWFCFVMSSSLASAMAICVTPFIPFDLIKIIIVIIIGPIIKKRLNTAKK